MWTDGNKTMPLICASPSLNSISVVATVRMHRTAYNSNMLQFWTKTIFLSGHSTPPIYIVTDHSVLFVFFFKGGYTNLQWRGRGESQWWKSNSGSWKWLFPPSRSVQVTVPIPAGGCPVVLATLQTETGGDSGRWHGVSVLDSVEGKTE